MSTAVTSHPRLSICIATFNRADVICNTLDTITAQLSDGVEVLVVDGASTDDTESVMNGYCELHAGVRYIRETVNSGVDADFDKAVHYARGDYCWLMTDDDLMKNGAITRVLDELASDPELLVVDAEVWNIDFTKLWQPSRMYLSEDRYFPETNNDFLALAGDALSFIGAVVIRRDVWLRRAIEPYYGSLFVHCGAILQAPALRGVKVLADPLIQIRYGNAMWTPRSFEIWMFLWPTLIWGFSGYSEDAKRLVSPEEPWRDAMKLFKHRARGGYSLAEYRGYVRERATGLDSVRALSIALLPGAVANVLAVAFVVTLSRQSRLGLCDLLSSPHAGKVSRALARFFPLRDLD